MLKRDYLLRLIQEFMEALFRAREIKDVRKLRTAIDNMYEEYLGPSAFYHTAAMDDVMDSFARFPENERLQRMEMLAELYYAETSVTSGPDRDRLLRRSLALFGFIDRHDRTFNLDRLAKISEIKSRLENS